VKRHLPILRHFTKGDLELLPGKLVALFDVRLQQWLTIEYIEQATQNGLEVAKARLRSLPSGTLILADLGFFGFKWFDELTEWGYSWISRAKNRATVVVVHTYYEAGDTFDRLVWLGAWNTHGKHVVRQVQFRQGGQLRQYFTNVCDPTVLPLAEIARLYARRWDIELADQSRSNANWDYILSGAANRWSSSHKCGRVSFLLKCCKLFAWKWRGSADVDAFEVSLPLLIEALPQFGLQGRDGIAESVRQGRRLGIIRPSTRLSIEAPEIPREQLIPLPKDTVLCRQPCYTRRKQNEKAKSQEMEVHPQRDQLVAILMQREAEIKMAKRDGGQPAPSPKRMPSPPQVERRNGSVQPAATRPLPPVQPDGSIIRPSWPFLQPLMAQV
jgi:hypothetical protein